MKARAGMCSTGRGENGRELHAVLLAFVWLVGIEASPLHHQLSHASIGAHVHDEAGLHVHSDGTRHAHAGALAPQSHDEGDEGPRLLSSASRPGHGAGSLAHRSLLFPAPPAAVPAIPSALFAYALAYDDEPALHGRTLPTRARARAPPIDDPVRGAVPAGL